MAYRTLPIDDSTPQLNSPARYIIWRFSSTYYGKNMVTGETTSNAAALTEIQAVLTAVAAAGGGTIFIKAGTYMLTGELTYSGDNLTIAGEGDATILDVTTFAAGTDVLQIEGAVTAVNTIVASNIAAGDDHFHAAAGGGVKFAAGDWVRVRSEELYETSDNKYGEMREVESVAGDIVTIVGTMTFAYTTANTATVDKLTVYKNIILRDFKILDDAGVDNRGIYLYNTINVKVQNIHIYKCNSGGIYFYNSVDGLIEGCTVEKANAAGGGGGILFVNLGRDNRAINNRVNDCNQAIMTDHSTTYGLMVNTVFCNNVITDCVNGAFLAEWATYGVMINNNAVTGGPFGYYRGKNIIIANNTIRDTFSALDAIIISPNVNGIIIEGNQIYTINDGISNSSDTAAISNVVIRGNKIYSTVEKPINFSQTFTNMLIDGNVLESGNDVCLQMSSFKASGNSTDLVIRGNIMKGVAEVIYCLLNNAGNYTWSNVIIEGNDLYGGTYCLYMGTSATNYGSYLHLFIHGNLFNDGTTGVYAQAFNACVIHSNYFFNATTGVNFAARTPTTVGHYLLYNFFKTVGTRVVDTPTGLVDTGSIDLA